MNADPILGFELWDTESRNMIAFHDTLPPLLDLIRGQVDDYSLEAVNLWSVLVVYANGELVGLGTTAELLQEQR